MKVGMRAQKWAWSLLGLIMFPAITLACTVGEHEEVIEKFLAQTLEERRSSILQYPLEMQVELYVNAMMRKHPPDLGLAIVVAGNGAKIIPTLIQRLSREKSEIVKLDLIAVFERMQQFGTYDVASDQRTMAFLNQQVAEMEASYWKERASAKLKHIRGEK